MATTVNVTVLATDQNNDPVDGATVTAKLSHADVDSTYGYILPEEVSGTTNASGQVVLALWPNELGSTESYYVFKISNPDTGKVQRINATIPNANCNLHAVAESPTYSPGQVTTAPLNANLASIASLTTAADKVLYFSGANTAALANFTAAGRALVDDADAAAQRVTLGLGNVNNTSDADKQISTATQAALDAKQPLDAELTAIAGLTSAADRVPYFTGLGAAAVAVFTSAARTFTAAVDAAAQRVAIGLGNVDDTSDADKPVSTAQAAADAAVLSSAQSYADGLVVGLIDDRGNYDASVNTFPASGGSGSAGAIKKGDLWTVSVAGTLGGHAVTAGDVIRALVDTPGQTDSNWAITENNFGYVAENSANKDASGGYAGLTLFKINFRNALNTITSFFTNANTAQRTYTFQDRDGTIADLEQFAASTGSSLVGHIASGSGAVATTVQQVLRETVNAFRYFTAAQISDVETRTASVDVSASVQLALNTGKDVYCPEGTYFIDEMVMLATQFQKLRGAGRGKTIFKVNSTFNLAADGVFKLNAAACTIEDITITFDQSSATDRASLVAYPPAIYCQSHERPRLRRIRLNSAYRGVDARGNTGGAIFDDLELGVLHKGLEMDGAADTVELRNVRTWPYGFSGDATLYGIYSDGTTIGFEIGGVDDLKMINCTPFRTKMRFYDAGTGNGSTFGHITALSLDARYSRLDFEAGNIEISGIYKTTDVADDYAILQTGGKLRITNHYLSTNGAINTPLVHVNGSDAILHIANGHVVTSSTDVIDFQVANGRLSISDTHFGHGTNQARTVPFIKQTGGRLHVENCSVGDIGTGSGDFIEIGVDERHVITGNSFLGWGFNIPSSSPLGLYGPNLAVGTDTFTPAVSFTTNGDFSPTYTTQTGRYWIEGGLVHFLIQLYFNTNAYTTASGNFRITGLPFSGAPITQYVQIGSFENIDLPAARQYLTGQIGSGGTSISLVLSGDNTTSALASTTEVVPSKNNVKINISGVYRK